METNTENKIEFKDKLLNLYNENKFKIYILIFILITIVISITFFKIAAEKKNSLIAENYVKAGIYLSAGKKEESTEIYKKIILSKNVTYSILALNTILEKNLISKKNLILDYFSLVEKQIKSKELKDLLLFKKALFLMNNNNTDKAEKLLKNLINNKSKIKLLAEEILIK